MINNKIIPLVGLLSRFIFVESLDSILNGLIGVTHLQGLLREYLKHLIALINKTFTRRIHVYTMLWQTSPG